MSDFIIDGFNFGIDPSRSSVAIQDGALTLKIVGNSSVVEKLDLDAGEPWSWLIQSPFLYVVSVPCNAEQNGDFNRIITDEDLNEYDIALYLGEHCDVDPCRISKVGNLLTIDGLVHDVGNLPLAFKVNFETA